MNQIKAIAFLCVIFSCPVLAGASYYMKPLETKNMHVLYLPYLFLPFEDSRTLPALSNELRLNFYKSSTYFDSYIFREAKRVGEIDLESTYVGLTYSRSIADGLEARVSLAYIYHGSGYLDPVIENFHHALGLPNGGREYEGDNRIHIQMNGPKGSVDIQDSLYSFADPSFYLKKQIILNGKFGLAVLGGIKIPIGKTSFINSKTFDLGFSANADYTGRIIYLFSNIGVTWFIGDSQFKEEFDQDRHYSITYGAGLGFKLSGSLGLFMQFHCQTSPYSTGIERIDSVSVLHSFGVRWQWTDSFLLQLSADEDTFTYATVDIAFLLQGEYRF